MTSRPDPFDDYWRGVIAGLIKGSDLGPKYLPSNEEFARAAYEAGRASRDADVSTVERQRQYHYERGDEYRVAAEAAEARVRELEAALNAKVDAELERQDEGAWKAAHEAQQRVRELERELADSEAGYKSAMDSITDLGNEMRGREDAALGMVAALREALSRAGVIVGRDSSDADIERAARQHEERIRREERERCANGR